MNILLQKSIYYLIYILFLGIFFINSHFFEAFGVNFLSVNGAYEFTKSIFFDIISSLIIILYFLKNLTNSTKIENNNLFIFLVLFWLIILTSTIFSSSFYNSFFGSQEKGHSFLMWNNLIGLLIIFYKEINQKLEEKLNNFLIFLTLFLALIGLKQHFFPDGNYNDFGKRLFGTMGHPNYISPIFLMTLPYLQEKIKIKKENLKFNFYLLSFFVIFIALLLTKSFVAIFLYINYLIYSLFIKNNFSKYKIFKKTYLFGFFYILLIILGFLSIFSYFPDKSSSFISRFYIFETVIKIIFSDIKIFLFGIGFENLPLYFDNFKNIHLYIFENIGFTADRSHNIILDFFIFNGVFGFILILYLYFYIFKSLKNDKFYNYSLFLGSIFLLFNPGNISFYLIFTLYLSFSLKNNFSLFNSFLPSQEGQKIEEGQKFEKIQKLKNLFFLKSFLINLFLAFIMLFSVINIIFSFAFFIAETYVYKKNYEKAINYFAYNPNYYYKIGKFEKGLEIEKFKSENYYLSKINYSYGLENNCEYLVKNFNSVENLFYCGNIFYRNGLEEKAIIFYNLGLKKLPDLWNKNSIYNKNIFIKKFINGNRFFSTKYSNLKEILEISGKNIDFK